MEQEADFGEGLETLDLEADGANKAVTDDNKQHYVDLYVRHLLETSIKRQFDAFQRGFKRVRSAIVGPDVVSKFTTTICSSIWLVGKVWCCVHTLQDVSCQDVRLLRGFVNWQQPYTLTANLLQTARTAQYFADQQPRSLSCVLAQLCLVNGVTSQLHAFARSPRKCFFHTLLACLMTCMVDLGRFVLCHVYVFLSGLCRQSKAVTKLPV